MSIFKAPSRILFEAPLHVDVVHVDLLPHLNVPDGDGPQDQVPHVVKKVDFFHKNSNLG